LNLIRKTYSRTITNQNLQRGLFGKVLNVKAVELRLIAELVKDGRRSDRELAKILGISQPTVRRIRTRLEKEGLIEYTVIPNFAKMGFEILAFTIGKFDIGKHLYDAGLAKNFVARRPQVIFAAGGMGAGFNRIAVSVHKNFPEYSKFAEEGRVHWSDLMSISHFVVDLKGESILQPLSFQHFADYLLKEAMSMQSAEKNQKQHLSEKEKE